jgi:hypothetical protein
MSPARFEHAITDGGGCISSLASGVGGIAGS